MVTLILALCIPVMAIVTGFLTFKSVQLGLRWQMEIKQVRPPTLDSPIQPIIERVEHKQQVKQTEEVKSVFNEWVNGSEE